MEPTNGMILLVSYIGLMVLLLYVQMAITHGINMARDIGQMDLHMNTKMAISHGG
jgi:hypothetical protein